MSKLTVKLNLQELADDLTSMRNFQGKSLLKVSQELDVSTATIQRIETKRYTPELATYIKICRYVNKPFNHYFTVE